MAVTNPVEFDPFSDDYFNDPTEIYRRLRDEAPVYFSERYGLYALSRFADVLAAHRDWQGFSSAHGIELFTFSKDPEEIASYRSIIMMDPPEHRTLLNSPARRSPADPLHAWRCRSRPSPQTCWTRSLSSGTWWSDSLTPCRSW